MRQRFEVVLTFILYSSLNLFTDEANINNSRRMLFKIPANTSAKVFIANGHNVSFRDGQKYPEWSRGILYIEGILLGAIIPLLFSSIYYSFLFKDKANIWFSIYLFFTIISFHFPLSIEILLFKPVKDSIAVLPIRIIILGFIIEICFCKN